MAGKVKRIIIEVIILIVVYLVVFLVDFSGILSKILGVDLDNYLVGPCYLSTCSKPLNNFLIISGYISNVIIILGIIISAVYLIIGVIRILRNTKDEIIRLIDIIRRIIISLVIFGLFFIGVKIYNSVCSIIYYGKLEECSINCDKCTDNCDVFQ